MALGSANANQNNRRYSNTYYSGLRIRNYSDHNAINISFSNGLMNIGIAKEDEESHKYTNEIEAYITPKKAMVLLDQMQHFENNEDGVFGIVLGMSDIQTAIGFQLLNDNENKRIDRLESDIVELKEQLSMINNNTYNVVNNQCNDLRNRINSIGITGENTNVRLTNTENIVCNIAEKTDTLTDMTNFIGNAIDRINR